MQLFTRIDYNGMSIEYWAPETFEEGYNWNIVVFRGNEFKGERKFNQMDIKNNYVGIFEDIAVNGKSLVDLLISQGK